MQIDRRAFLRTGAIPPTAALAGLLAEHVVEAEEEERGEETMNAHVLPTRLRALRQSTARNSTT